jgi:hypothetical protein
VVVTAAETQEMAAFIMLTTEVFGALVALETPHTSDPSFDPAMILCDAVIHVSTGPMSHVRPQHAADRSGISAMAVRGYSVRAKAHGGLGRAEEGLRGLHVALLAQHGVDPVFVPVDRPITVTPLAPDLQLRLLYLGPIRHHSVSRGLWPRVARMALPAAVRCSRR